MVEFWGIFVVFSACAAVQITEAHNHDTYSSSEEDKDTQSLTHYNPLQSSNLPQSLAAEFADTDPTNYANPPKRHNKASSEESVEIVKVPVKSNKHLNLAQRLRRLYDFSLEIISKYEQDYVHLTGKHIHELHNELAALNEKSADIVEKLKEVRKAAQEIDEIKFDVANKANFKALESAMDTIVYLNISPENATAEFEGALEKVNWFAKRKNLDYELSGFLREFGRKFAKFIKTLTPLERLMSIAFVDLQRRYRKADAANRWRLLNEFWVLGNFD